MTCVSFVLSAVIRAAPVAAFLFGPFIFSFCFQTCAYMHAVVDFNVLLQPLFEHVIRTEKWGLSPVENVGWPIPSQFWLTTYSLYDFNSPWVARVVRTIVMWLAYLRVQSRRVVSETSRIRRRRSCYKLQSSSRLAFLHHTRNTTDMF